MNDLGLRISKGKKGDLVKPPSSGISPIIFSELSRNKYEKNEKFMDFLCAPSADEQLRELKKLLNENTKGKDSDFISFLVIVFLEGEAKHPIKCFLTRYIIKQEKIQDSFEEILVVELKLILEFTRQNASVKRYTEAMKKFLGCSENFTTGTAALKKIVIELMELTKDVFCFCVETLKNVENLSPTDKNNIFNLIHLVLRVQLPIIQKIDTKNKEKLQRLSPDIINCIYYFLLDDEVPMDTKSICGMLYLLINSVNDDPDYWIKFLQENNTDQEYLKLLRNDSAQITLYSAMINVIPIKKLETTLVGRETALINLTKNILLTGERCSSESTLTLCVTRTIHHICKNLENIEDKSVGKMLVKGFLAYILAHFEHYMDSVQHLTAQVFGYIARYCCRLEKEGENQPMTNLYSFVTSLPNNRKSYFVSLTALIMELGASVVLSRFSDLIFFLINSLEMQAVQASAATTLETLLQKYLKEVSIQRVTNNIIQPLLKSISLHRNEYRSDVIHIMENILAKAIKLDQNVMNFLLPFIKYKSASLQTMEQVTDEDLKCILVLLNVARKSGIIEKLSSDCDNTWKGILHYDVLKGAAIYPTDEIRALSLSLVVESPKSTEVFSEHDFDFVLWFVQYNVNTQSPHFRQLTLSSIKKFIQRVEDSYRVVKRQKTENEDIVSMYLSYMENFRKLCFNSLIPSANYSRRVIALKLLLWCEQIYLEEYTRSWTKDYVEKLLTHLDDSYENNKALVLEILEKCPTEMLIDNNHNALNMEYILREASSVKPTDCTSAAYKFILKQKLLRQQDEHQIIPDNATYTLLLNLLNKLKEELEVAKQSILLASSQAPMYGLLHCICHLLKKVSPCEVSGDANWSTLISDIITTCITINETVAPVVNNSSPEGHLPMDLEPVAPHLEDFGVKMEDGTKITAQMVLLCAWRSVKEVSLILGDLASSLKIQGDDSIEGAYTLTQDQIINIGEHFTTLLYETKHRGAFEQAHLGFTKLVTRLWRYRGPCLHALPRLWLTSLMEDIAVGDDRNTHCPTRRSAGLPFMIQALVTTELQVFGNAKCFHECMTRLLKLANPDNTKYTSVETRTHSMNILRALFRHTDLGENVSSYIAEGLIVAISGFDSMTWLERNSSTLLFSALVIRIFGVQRGRDGDNLCIRNRMTGRIFFMRYPELYDFMLEKVIEGSREETRNRQRPSLYPVLLILARLYPSSLEGVVTNLQLLAFTSYVLLCAGSGVLKTRQLAAKAMVPLISPDIYLSHLDDMFSLISNPKIKRNYCHGVLLQIIKLLQNKPDNLVIGEGNSRWLAKYLEKSFWILRQTLTSRPCYILADEFMKVITIVLRGFPSIITSGALINIEVILDEILFGENAHSSPYSGKYVCLANAAYLNAIILTNNKSGKFAEFILEALCHPCYEVILSTLNILMTLYNVDPENDHNVFLTHWVKMTNKTELLNKIRSDKQYLVLLCTILKENNYMECVQKALTVLSMEDDTQQRILRIKNPKENISGDEIIFKLIECVETEHEKVTHIYLKCLAKYVTKLLTDGNIETSTLMTVLNVFWQYGSSENNEWMRGEVVNFIELNYQNLMCYRCVDSQKCEMEYYATLCATIAMLLEDEEEAVRQKMANVVCRITDLLESQSNNPVIPSRAGELFRNIVFNYHDNADDAIIMLLILSLLDFKSEVCIADELNSECRIFDQSERYNVFLEETVWSRDCMKKLETICAQNGNRPFDIVPELVERQSYRAILEKLCNNNFTSFLKMLREESETKTEKNINVNPKVELVVKSIRDTHTILYNDNLSI